VEFEEENAYAELMKYHKTKNKFRLQLKLAKFWILHSLAAKVPIPTLTVKLHRMRGIKIGNGVFIGDNVHLDLLHPDLITIEDNVSIGMRTMIFTHRSHWSPDLQNIYPRTTAAVVLKKGCWVAPGCIILPGVTIGKNSIIGSGSIVLKDVEPLTVVAGNPAKFIKKIDLDKL
jgi:acetyltransferase-like isoleucine patch superfamily enzyme